MDENLCATQNKLMHGRMWTDEASLAVSLIKAIFATLHTFVNSGIRHA